MKYAIYPPIGIARLGNSEDFFLCPDKLDSLGTQIDSSGNISEVSSFKDENYLTKKQAIKFQIYEIPENGDAPRPLQLTGESEVEWFINVANKKDAVIRPVSPPDFPLAINLDSNRLDRHIQASCKLKNTDTSVKQLIGKYQNEDVSLGSVKGFMETSIIFCGGNGRSETLTNPPAQIGSSFYNNPDWFDDTCDGIISAELTLSNGESISIEPAWVIVAPPDFSPSSSGLVTLYDLILEVAIDEGMVDEIETPYFDSDIKPIIERASNLSYVSGNPIWQSFSTDWDNLSNPNLSNSILRNKTFEDLESSQVALHSFELREWQINILTKWAEGNFHQGINPNISQLEQITRIVLDNGLGQGLYPGIEAGVNMMNPDIYIKSQFEFRINSTYVKPGDLTALMALPWQADFLKCSAGWWPAQRPNLAPQLTGASRPWLRPDMNHQQLVDNVMKLGIISPDINGSSKVIEQGRHPDLGQ